MQTNENSSPEINALEPPTKLVRRDSADGSKNIAVAVRSVPIDNGKAPGGTPTKQSESESASVSSTTRKRSLAQSTQSTPSIHQLQTTEHIPTKSEIKILERGNVFFFYRLKVNLGEDKTDPASLDDVQRFYILLCPQADARDSAVSSSSRPRTFDKLLIIGRKVLPDPDIHERFWGYVDKVVAGNDIKELVDDKLVEKRYETILQGDKILPEAQLCANGVYAIASKYESQTHFSYVLRNTKESGKMFNIREEGSFIISVKNPLAPPPKQRADGNANNSSNQDDVFRTGGAPPTIQKPVLEMYPEHLQSLFGTSRFHPLSRTEFLEYEGAEFILSGVTSDVVQDLGERGAELEGEEFNDNRAKILGILRDHLVHNSEYLSQVLNEHEPPSNQREGEEDTSNNDEEQNRLNNTRAADGQHEPPSQQPQQQPHQIKSLSQ